MRSQTKKDRPAGGRSSMLIVAWIGTLLVSALPTILWIELVQVEAPWIRWTKIAILATLVVLTFAWRAIRPLRGYLSIFLTLFVADILLHDVVSRSGFWRSLFSGSYATWSMSMLNGQLIRLGVSLVMIAALLVMRYRREDFFLVRGQLDAPVGSLRWPGLWKPVAWTRFGGILAIIVSAALLVFLPSPGIALPQALRQALPLLPAVLALAAMNAFNEEMTYRAALLAPLHQAIGKGQALLLTAAVYGLGHYYGVPHGVGGVILACVLGWLLGKSMLETRGFFWAWFIHFLQDVIIFAMLSIGAVNPGGG